MPFLQVLRAQLVDAIQPRGTIDLWRFYHTALSDWLQPIDSNDINIAQVGQQNATVIVKYVLSNHHSKAGRHKRHRLAYSREISFAVDSRPGQYRNCFPARGPGQF